MKIAITDYNHITDVPSLATHCRTQQRRAVARIARTIVPIGAFLTAIAGTASAQSPNLGDPLFCQPQEGVAFLIVNGGLAYSR